MTKSTLAALALALGAVSLPVHAATIIPVSVTATSTFNNGFYTPDNLINGSGLSGGQHDGFFGNMWMTEQGATSKLAQITFDLGAIFTMTGADIWQFNYADGVQIPGVISTLDRGVKNFRILTSLDGASFTEALSSTLARGTGALEAAQNFAFGGDARYVQIDVLSNYAEGTIYTTYASGLSEVRFSSTGAVPEPATWAMMIAGFGIAGASLRRRKAVVRFA